MRDSLSRRPTASSAAIRMPSRCSTGGVRSSESSPASLARPKPLILPRDERVDSFGLYVPSPVEGNSAGEGQIIVPGTWADDSLTEASSPIAPGLSTSKVSNLAFPGRKSNEAAQFLAICPHGACQQLNISRGSSRRTETDTAAETGAMLRLPLSRYRNRHPVQSSSLQNARWTAFRMRSIETIVATRRRPYLVRSRLPLYSRVEVVVLLVANRHMRARRTAMKTTTMTTTTMTATMDTVLQRPLYQFPPSYHPRAEP